MYKGGLGPPQGPTLIAKLGCIFQPFYSLMGLKN